MTYKAPVLMSRVQHYRDPRRKEYPDKTINAVRFIIEMDLDRFSEFTQWMVKQCRDEEPSPNAKS